MARELRRATSGAPAAPARKPGPRLIAPADLTRQGQGLGQFIGEIRSELKKVVWPTRREAGNLTLLVIGLSVAVGFILGTVDFLFQQLFRLILGA